MTNKILKNVRGANWGDITLYKSWKGVYIRGHCVISLSLLVLIDFHFMYRYNDSNTRKKRRSNIAALILVELILPKAFLQCFECYFFTYFYLKVVVYQDFRGKT